MSSLEYLYRYEGIAPICRNLQTLSSHLSDLLPAYTTAWIQDATGWRPEQSWCASTAIHPSVPLPLLVQTIYVQPPNGVTFNVVLQTQFTRITPLALLDWGLTLSTKGGLESLKNVVDAALFSPFGLHFLLIWPFVSSTSNTLRKCLLWRVTWSWTKTSEVRASCGHAQGVIYWWCFVVAGQDPLIPPALLQAEIPAVWLHKSLAIEDSSRWL